jgi:hypothetical protein
MYVKYLSKDFFPNFFLLFQLISQIRTQSIEDDGELLIQSLCSFSKLKNNYDYNYLGRTIWSVYGRIRRSYDKNTNSRIN